MVELALVLPLFFLLIFGLIDLGRFVLADSILSQGAREGARVAIVEAGWLGSTDPACGKQGGPVCPATPSALVSDVTSAANRMVAGLGGTITTVYLSCNPPGAAPSGLWTLPAPYTNCASNNTQGNLVSVRLVFTYHPITPVIGLTRISFGW